MSRNHSNHGLPLRFAITAFALPERAGIVDQCRSIIQHGQDWASMTGARQLLWRDLVKRCQDGELAVTGRRPGSLEFSEIGSQFLEHAIPDCDGDSITNADLTIANIFVKEAAEVARQTTDTRPYTTKDVELWFLERLKANPGPDLWFSADHDLADAKVRFPQVQRDTIRSLRKQFVPPERVKQGRRKKSANPRS